MNGLSLLLADPQLQAAAHWLGATAAADAEAYPVNAVVHLVLDRMMRYGMSVIPHETKNTWVKALQRLGLFHERLTEELSADAQHGGVTVESATAVFESPEGVRVINAAMSAVILTDDKVTIDVLAAMVAEVARKGTGTRLSLHIRQAAAALEMLQPRHLHILTQVFLVSDVQVPANVWPGDVRRDESVRLTEFDSWARLALRAAASPQIRPQFDDLVELEAQRLILRSNSASTFDAKLRPSGSRVAQRLAQAGFVGSLPLARSTFPALERLERLEFGEDLEMSRDFRDFALPALGAYTMTGAGYVLGTTLLRERGVGVGINLEEWAADRGLVSDVPEL